jgi:O-antigen/teichoic acid export membrane protein
LVWEQIFIILLDAIHKLKEQYQQKIAKNPILKGLFIIGSGTVIAQSISIVIYPILTRLFTPSDFGIFAVYTSLFSIMIVTASFRYDFAIPLPKENYKAVNLMILCFILIIGTGFTFLVLFTLFKDSIISTFHLESIENYLWLLIISFIGAGIYQILNAWAIRQRGYFLITKTLINQNVSGSLVKIVLGYLKIGALGLIVGDIFSKVTGIGTLFREMWRKEKQVILHDVSLTNIRLFAREYRHFPMYSFPASVLNVIALEIPVLMLSYMFDLQVVGWFSLANVVLSIPLSLISYSLGQVYCGEMTIMLREKKGDILVLFRSVTKKLFLIGLPIIGIPAIFAPFIFPVIFGSVWRDAGWFCYPLAIMTIANFCVSATATLGAYGFNYLQLIWDLIRTVSVLSGFYVAMILHLPPLQVIFVYAIIMAISYYFLYHLNIYAIKHREITPNTLVN